MKKNIYIESKKIIMLIIGGTQSYQKKIFCIQIFFYNSLNKQVQFEDFSSVKYNPGTYV